MIRLFNGIKAIREAGRLPAILITALVLLAPSPAHAFKSVLEGKHAIGTNWVNGPLLGWKELDLIPLRTLHTSGPATNEVIIISFDHTKGVTIPGIQDLAFFTPSSNVIITAAPTLSAPAGVDIWKYTFTITVINNQPGTVEFRARMSAGSHLFPGASLNLSLPGPGQMQISKAAATLGTPDLALSKSGPNQVSPGQVITYALSYTNKFSSPDTGNGVQVTDILPPEVTYVTNSSSRAVRQTGNTLTWDLPNLAPGEFGLITYRVVVTNNLPITTTFANYAQIQSSQNDATPADNASSVSTTVVVTPAPVAYDDFYTTEKNQTLIIPAPGVLINDSNALSGIRFSGPNYGTLTFNTNGSFTYLPATDFIGVDIFAYQAVNSTNISGPATVTINVISTCNFTVSTNLTVNNDPGLCGAVVNYPPPVTTGSCSPVICLPPSGSLFPVGTTTVTCTNLDGISRSFQITVLDIEVPAIVCPGDLVRSNGPDQCSRSNVTYSVTFTDNCPGGTLVQTAGLPSGSEFPKGTTTNSFTITDASGNTNSCSFTVTINDTQSPTLSCPSDVTVNVDLGVCVATGVALGSPVATDNCGTVTVSNNAPAQFPLGTNVVTWTATDASGNTATCQQQVIVRDNQAPVIVCPADMTVNADAGECSVTGLVLTNPTATDNCGTVTLSNDAPAQFPVGTNLVTWTATDASGNSTVCLQPVVVIVIDSQTPTITCPADVTVNADAGSCVATGVILGSPTATDNCVGFTVTSNAPAQFPVGTNVVIWTVTDVGGNTVACQQQVIVHDSQLPTISCPADVTVNVDLGVCVATGVALGTPTTSDNCGTVTVSSNAPAQFPVGTNVVTWTATDASGNTATCQQQVIVRDNQAPKITCPADMTVNADAGECSVTGLVLTNPTATDNCGTVTLSNDAPAQFPVGTNLVTWTATDASGNSTVCLQPVVVIVIDSQTPTITCPADVTVNADAGSCVATGVILGSPTATDNCVGFTVTSNAPAQFPVGTNVVIWTVTDVGGNTVACQQQVIVHDSQLPTISCPADVTVNVDLGVCVATGVALGTPTTSDNCGTVTVSSNAPAQFPVGTNVVTWTATDASGNTATCQQQVIVRDNQAPKITCPADMTVNADAGECSVTGLVLTNPTATDNCGTVTLSNDAPAQFPVGTNLVTWTATDASGNSTVCLQPVVVIVIDSQNPTITCPADITVNADPGVCVATGVNLGSPTATDNCVGFTVTSNAPAQFPVGTNVVIWTVTDVGGNTVACQQQVIVHDSQLPTISCPADVTVNVDLGVCVATGVALGTPTTSDNCGTVTVSSNAPAQFPVGTNVVTWTATDASGNTVTCQQRVIVRDNQPPTLTCPADVTVNIDPGVCVATAVVLGSPTSSDICGSVTVSSDAPAQFPVGTNVVTWTATDAGGNSTTCQQRVVVRDNQPPSLTCPADVTVNIDPGTCVATGVVLGSPTFSDICGSVTVSNDAPAQFPVGTSLVTWTATDASGNSTTCQQRIIVRDNQPPTLTCPAAVTVNVNAGTCVATGVVLGSPITSDICGSVTVSSDAPAQFPVGTNVVTWTATDAGGNSATCQQQVIVRDNQTPTITCPAAVTVNVNAGACVATGVVLGNPISSDNCGSVTVSSDAPAQFPLGTNVVTWTVTDASGNSTTCQQQVIVRDNQTPTITCPAAVTVNVNAGACVATGVVLGNPISSDNCGSVTVSSDAPAQFPLGTNVVTWTVTDASGNSTTCQQQVIVRDNQPPILTCPVDVFVNVDPGTCVATGVIIGSPITSDNCGSVTVSSDAPTQFPVGTNVVTWTATDAGGNNTTCQQRVIVRDIQPPTLSCPADVTVNVNAGLCVASGVALGSPITTDNCGTVTVSSNAPAQFPLGTNVVTWTATDASGNTTTCQQRVIVRDNLAPLISCPPNIVVNAAAGLCASNVTFSVTATDNCGAVTNIVSVPASGSVFPVGVTTVTNTATDSSGNRTVCTFTVTVRDIQPPTISCPADVTVNVNAALCVATGVVLGTPITTDNCGPVTSTNNAPAQFPLGTNVVTWTATDASGNTTTCQQRVIVRDNLAPLISCPPNIVVNAAAGLCASNVTFSVTATDNCGAVTNIVSVPASGSVFPVGVTTVTNTATDSSGNRTVCTFTVTVRDIQPPTLSCPADVTVNVNAGLCVASGVALGSPITTDNCGTVTVSSNAPAQFPLGTNVVTWTATDASGNTTTCQQRVIVRDNLAPLISCPPNIVVNAAAGLCASNVTFSVTATDNCGAVTNIVSVPASGSVFPVGVTTVTNTATDSSGNRTVCTFTVTVRDIQPPTLSCPADVTVNVNAGLCVATGVVLGTPITTDNCGPVTSTNNAPAQFPLGTNVVTWTATDASGNTTTCQQRVIVRDNLAPLISCPPNIVVNAAAGLCASNVTFSVTATDNCGAVTNIVSVPASGSVFPVGVTTVTNTATDNSGNRTVCTFTVTVRDIQPPTLSCPADVTVNVNAGLCVATGVVLGTPITTDNCGPVTSTNNAPAQFPLGTNVVTWTTTDASGNTTTCQQRVIVRDNLAPLISCPPNIVVNAAAGLCASNVTFSVTATDNCGAVTNIVSVPASGSVFPVGVTTVTNTATDSSGNRTVCTLTVTVRDIQPPTISCPADVTVNVNAALCVATGVVLGTPITTDNCGTVTISSNAPAQFPLGTNVVTWTATDASGNTTTCQQRVIVRDNLAPLISCPPNIVVNAAAGLCASNVTFSVTATDNCGAVTNIVSVPASGSVFPVGVTTVTNTATDNSGNRTVCTFTVTVRDIQPPTLSCPADVTVNVNAGLCVATGVVLGTPITTDNCGPVTSTNNAPAQFPLGTNVVTWTTTDASGNTTTCQQRVIVRDNLAPLISCPPNIVVNAAAGLCASNVTFSVTATDNCGAVTNIVSVPASGSVFPVGVTTVTNTATDNSGNRTVCTFTVTVRDIQPPTLSCPADVTVVAPHGQSSLAVNFPAPTVSDNCSGATANASPASGSIFPLGTTTVTCIATDAAGNSANCNFTVTVRSGNNPPVADNQLVTTPQDAPVSITLTGSDTDGDPLTFALVSGPGSGVINGFNTTTGTLLYTPSLGFIGNDSFTFRVNDGFNDSATATVTVVVAPQADVAVIKTGSRTGSAGTNISFTVTVTNLGPTTASNVVVFDQLPASYTFISSIPAPASVVDNLLTWPTFNLAAHASSNFSIIALPMKGGVFTNVALATNDTPDPDLENNDGSWTNSRVTTFVQPLSDVAVFKTGPATVVAGGSITYTITVTNRGPLAATNTIVSDTLPADATFSSASGNYTLSNGVVRWPASTLGIGASATYTIAVVAPLSGILTNVASATSDTPDPFPDNNNGTSPNSRVTTLVQSIADVAVLKAGPNYVTPGQTFAYTITVNNLGPVTAANVVVEDLLPADVVFVSASGGGVLSGNTITWPALAELASGATTIFTITATAPGSGQFTNVARANSSTLDPDPVNNNGTAASSQVVTFVVPGEFTTVQGPNWLNPQTGLYEQRVTVTNRGSTTIAAFRLLVGDIRSTNGVPRTNVFMANATGTNVDGRPYVQYNAPLNPGSWVTLILEFRVPDRRPFTNSIEVLAVLPAANGATAEGGVEIDHWFLDERSAEPRFVIEWTSVPGRTYTIIYSDTGISGPWHIATPTVKAASNRVQWYDDGPPKTISQPSSVSSRYYRVIELIANP